jgi:hypothetical protein
MVIFLDIGEHGGWVGTEDGMYYVFSTFFISNSNCYIVKNI